MYGIEPTHSSKGKSVVTLVIASTNFKYSVPLSGYLHAVFRKFSEPLTRLGQ